MKEKRLQANSAELKKQGFTKIEGVWSEAEVRQIRNEITRYCRELAPKVGLPDAILIEDDWQKPLSLSRMDHYDSYFLELRNSPRLQAIAETLLGEEVQPMGLELFNQIPGYSRQTPPHQDAVNMLFLENRALTFWMPLLDFSEANGSLRYVRGSHSQGPRAHSTQWNEKQYVTSPYREEDQQGEASTQGKAGDIYVHTTFTLHLSNPNPSEAQRWALGLPFMAPDILRARDHGEWNSRAIAPVGQNVWKTSDVIGQKLPAQ